MTTEHECPVDGCEYTHESLSSVNTHLGRGHDSETKREVYLNEIRRVAELIGETPSLNEMADRGRYGRSNYPRVFGSWNDALREAGFEPNFRRNIPDQELIEELQRLDSILGHPPTQEDMRKRGKFGDKRYKTQFGSWNNGLRSAGFDPNHQVNHPKQELIDEIRRLAGILDRPPRSMEMADVGKYSRSCYQSRFGSWNDALREAGLEPPQHGEWNASGEDHWAWQGGRAWYYGPNWKAQRQKAVERDDCQCVECGMTREEHYEEYGDDLCVHHERPLATFPFIDENHNRDWEQANDLSNLTTCCSGCHRELDGESWDAYPPEEYTRHVQPEEWETRAEENEQLIAFADGGDAKGANVATLDD